MRIRKYLAGSIVGLALVGAAAAGQSAADAFFVAKDWTHAAPAYEEIVAHDPADALAWYRLGMSRHQLRQYPQAAAAYEKAVALPSAPRGVRYNLACVYALMNRMDDAFRTLDQAVAAGFSNTTGLDADPDLAPLRADPRYAALHARMQTASQPCMGDPKARQFDFWAGDWDVKTLDGQTAGANTIQSLENGCILLENWTGSGGDSGKSLNYYDVSEGKWHQDWVDARGGLIHYAGEYADGAMRLVGELRRRDGYREMARGTWTLLPDGRVRQLGEASTDGGKTWQVRYDLYYARKGK
ncbi:MAG TPA: tetratricopeptide repeat protein [Patescibacteria group bacterium]|nr:tetratricopeptide repeat protein [Patescibacteria group bacterium]